MAALIVAGGSVCLQTVAPYLEGRRFDHVIAVDAGALAAEALGLKPDYLVGDFDTLGNAALEKWEKKPGVAIYKYNPEKDDTDMEIAVKLAISLEEGRQTGEGRGRKAQKTALPCFFPEQVLLLGATGTRLDHTLANIFMLEQFEAAGLSACILDANNRISVHHTGFLFEKQEKIGKYISFTALTKAVEGLTLTGFYYPLDRYTLLPESSRCISNEAAGEELAVEFESGRLLMIESMD